jgi:hypothetical protein
MFYPFHPLRIVGLKAPKKKAKKAKEDGETNGNAE